MRTKSATAVHLRAQLRIARKKSLSPPPSYSPAPTPKPGIYGSEYQSWDFLVSSLAVRYPDVKKLDDGKDGNDGKRLD